MNDSSPRRHCPARPPSRPDRVASRRARAARVPLLGLLGILAAAAIGLPESAQAQDAAPTPDPATQAEVMATIDRLFDGMRARDGDRVRSAFHPNARLASTRITDDGQPVVTFTEVDDFATAVGQGGDPWNEPYWNPVVQIDGALAQVWIFYRFHAGDTFSHCGHNAIQLARTPDEGWQIIGLTDSRRTTDCEAPDA